VRVASKTGLVALKLFRPSRQDEADIVAPAKTGRVELSSFPLTPGKMSAFQVLAEVAATDPHPPRPGADAFVNRDRVECDARMGLRSMERSMPP
jgi:hypothetical protein